jgi:predicted nucleotidyltransferase
MRVLLFGSRARGDYVQESDWDLIVISPAFAGVPFLRRGAEVAMAIFRADVGAAEVLCYSPEEFQAKSSELGIVGTAAGEGRFLI